MTKIKKTQAKEVILEADKLLGKAENVYSIFMSRNKNETLPLLKELLNEKFETANKSTLIQADYVMKNADTVIDIFKVLIPVSASVLVAINVLPREFQNNVSFITLILIFSIGGLLGTVYYKQKLIDRILKHLSEMDKIKQDAYKSHFDAVKDIIEKENDYSQRTINELSKSLKTLKTKLKEEVKK